MAHSLEVERVHKRFGDQEALRGIDLTIDAGHAVAVLGPSGSGTPTRVHCIDMLDHIDAGVIRLGDEALGWAHVHGYFHGLTDVGRAA